MRWGALAGVVVLLTACVGTGPAPVSATAPASTAASTTAARVPLGANAAPAATAALPGGGAFDPSAEAAERFRLWYEYESVPGADAAKEFERDTHPAGVGVCARRLQGVEVPVIRSKLQSDGWSLGGSAAVTRAALAALCPWREPVPPFRTTFDTNVNSAVLVLRNELPWAGADAAYYDVGWFVRAVCAQGRSAGVGSLEGFLHSHRAGGINAGTRAAAVVRQLGTDDALLRRATALAIRQVCFDVHDAVRYLWGL